MTALRAIRGGEPGESFGQSEEELIERCKGGDELAFRRLLEMHRRTIESAIRKELARAHLLTGHDAEVEDIAQEARMGLRTSIFRFQPSSEGKFSGYVAKIARNKTVDWMRKRFVHGRGGAQERWIDETATADADLEAYIAAGPSSAVSAEEGASRAEFRDRLSYALEQIPERQRRAWVAYRLEGQTLRVVGEELGVTEGRVKQLCNDAEANLRKQLAEYAEEREAA